MRNLYIGVVGYSQSNFNVEYAFKCMVDALKKILNDYPNSNPIIVSGLSAKGIPLVAYLVADKLGLETIGIAPKEIEQYKLYPVSKKLITGNIFGDESERFISVIDVLIKIGGGEQSEREMGMFKSSGKGKIYSYKLTLNEAYKKWPEYPSRKQIGPHAGKEFQMLLNKTKPAAMVHKSTFKWAYINPYIEAENWYVEYCPYNDDYIFTLPGEEYRAKKIIAIYKQIDSRPRMPGRMTNIDHIKIGRLLGYNKDDIRKFLGNINGNRTT